jgi:NAD(P)H-hydrate epimerase
MEKFKLTESLDLYKPGSDSHKGENGRLLIVGGSKLFHASIFWSADVASKIVDLVHFTSPAKENNELVRMKIKEGFWNGIVVPFNKIEEYMTEDDCVLIGPGMPRAEGLMEDEESTKEIVDYLLTKYPNNRWVVDGGALQEVDPKLLNNKMIITPHRREWEMMAGPLPRSEKEIEKQLMKFSNDHGGVTILLKGKRDYVCSGFKCFYIDGGNPGMTKGGTGDVLAGLVASIYCKNDPLLSAKVASLVNKKAGEKLAEKVGNYFNASDLVKVAPEVLAEL